MGRAVRQRGYKSQNFGGHFEIVCRKDCLKKLLTSKLHRIREITAMKTCTTVETITKTVKTEVVEDNTSINSPRSHSRYVTQYSSENEGRCCADVSQLAAIKRYITFFSIIFLNARVRLLCDSVARNPAA